MRLYVRCVCTWACACVRACGAHACVCLCARLHALVRDCVRMCMCAYILFIGNRIVID